MDRLLATACYLGLSLALAGSPGCGSTAEPAVDPVEQAQRKVLGLLYGNYLRQSRGQAPATEDQFVKFLETERVNWEKIVSNVEQLLTSPRDNKRWVILYGADLQQQNSDGATWVAYERDGVNGRRYVVSARGRVEEMDEQTFNQVFP